MGVGCRRVLILRVQMLELGSSTGSDALDGGEVPLQLLDGLTDDLGVVGPVEPESSDDGGIPTRSVAEDVGEIEGILGLASVAERKGLEYDEGRRPADGDVATSVLTVEGGPVQVDQDAFGEREFQAGRDDGPEIGLEVVDSSPVGTVLWPWDEEVHLQTSSLPSLDGGVA